MFLEILYLGIPEYLWAIFSIGSNVLRTLRCLGLMPNDFSAEGILNYDSLIDVTLLH